MLVEVIWRWMIEPRSVRFLRIVGPLCVVCLLGALSSNVMGSSAGTLAHPSGTRGQESARPPVLENFPVEGAHPFLTLLCKFADVAAEPRPPAFFKQMLGSKYPGLDNYWREASYHRMTLEGSEVAGWTTMPAGIADYRKADGNPDLLKLGRDCVESASGERDPFGYFGLNLVFNADLGTPVGGQLCLEHAGASGCLGAVWIWPPWLLDHATWAHEMGHALGLEHSRKDPGRDYGNLWDIMSESGACRVDPRFGRLAHDVIAYHKDRLGWIPEHSKLLVTAEGETTFTLFPVSVPAAAADAVRLARIPIDGSDSHFYTVEARARVGYDESLPFDAVVVHEVDGRARLAGATASITVRWQGGPEDGAAGSVFSDPDHGVTIRALRHTEEGFVVAVRLTAAAGRVQGLPPSFASSLALTIESVRNPRRPLLAASSSLAANPLGGIPADLPLARRKVVEDAAGHRHALWADDASGTVIYAMLGEDSEPRGHTVIDRGGSPSGLGAPVLVLGPQGSIYAAWSHFENGYWRLRVALRADARSEWTGPEEIDLPGTGDAWFPALAVDGRGRVYVLTRQRTPCGDGRYVTTLFLAVRNVDGKWNPTEKVDQNLTSAYLSGLRLISDLAGNLYAEWTDQSRENRMTYAAFRPVGGNWSSKWQVPDGMELEEPRRQFLESQLLAAAESSRG